MTGPVETQPDVLISDEAISVPAGWADPEWNALLAHVEWGLSIWMDQRSSPAVRAVLEAIPRSLSGLAAHLVDPAEDSTGSLCGCEEVGWWCATGDGARRTFVTFTRSDLDVALDEVEAITGGGER